MNKILFIFFLLSILFFSCKEKTNPPFTDSGVNVYRYYYGEKDGLKIWIVDGALIRKNIFNEFVFGGNDERYPFVPVNEIWIDNSVSSEEFETTLAHEINERNLMKNLAMTYFDAHDSSLAIELVMRRNYLKESLKHESILEKVAPLDFDSTQEIEDLPSLIKLKNIYLLPLRIENGIQIWVVDGFAVRREIYPDFGFSGNDLAYHFIPHNEIWIDGSITCEETEYSIILELKEREKLFHGLVYDSAYTESARLIDKLRQENQNLVLKQNLISKTNPIVRDTGIKF